MSPRESTHDRLSAAFVDALPVQRATFGAPFDVAREVVDAAIRH